MPFQGTASRAGRLCPFPPAGIAAPSGAAGRDGYRRLELSVPLCLRPGAGDLRQQQPRAAVFRALPAPVARQYPPSPHLSLGYLSEKNLKVLDAQFQQTYGITLAETARIAPAKSRSIILRKTDPAPLAMEYETRCVRLRKDHHPQAIKITFTPFPREADTYEKFAGGQVREVLEI